MGSRTLAKRLVFFHAHAIPRRRLLSTFSPGSSGVRGERTAR